MPSHEPMEHHAPLRKTPGFRQVIRELDLYEYWRKSGNRGDLARPVGEDDFVVTR